MGVAPMRPPSQQDQAFFAWYSHVGASISCLAAGTRGIEEVRMAPAVKVQPQRSAVQLDGRGYVHLELPRRITTSRQGSMFHHRHIAPCGGHGAWFCPSWFR